MGTLEANDAGLLASAAGGDCAGCRSLKGMTEIAKSAGITREALHKALRPGSAPGFDWGSIESAGCVRRSG
jgi:DNA-binding phage protein